jgi:protein-S-isoprenylcysteine O-methyltransferase Ste14
MQDSKHNPGFIVGNILLGLALVMLMFIDSLWAALGGWAMGLWMVLAGIGMYLVMSEKRTLDATRLIDP